MDDRLTDYQRSNGERDYQFSEPRLWKRILNKIAYYLWR